MLVPLHNLDHVSALNFSAGENLLCLFTLNAFAAWLYKSAAFSHFSVRPPKKLKPPVAPDAALSAFCNNALGSAAMMNAQLCDIRGLNKSDRFRRSVLGLKASG